MMSTYQQFVEKSSRGEYAQNKAHDDVAATLDGLGFSRIEISRKMSGGKLAQNLERVKWVLRCPFWRRKIRKDATIFLQYTISCWQGALAFRLLDERIKAKKNLKIIALVHDIKRTDVLNDCLTPTESRFFALCDVIFVHGENMKAFFIRHGVAAEKLRIFELFDYLTDVPMNPLTTERMNTVNVCGNLSPHKCGCYRDLGRIAGVEWKLYGPNFSPDYSAANVTHMGEFPPDVLPGKFTHGFGLIWDGDSSETQTGLFGFYQKINHPHKLSLYLAAGLPLIVWEENAIADFVTRNRIGFTISALRDIPGKIGSLSLEEYAELRKNAMEIGRKLRAGEIVKEAIEKALAGRA